MAAIVATFGASGHAVATAGHGAICVTAIATPYSAELIAVPCTLDVVNTACSSRTMLTIVAGFSVGRLVIATCSDRAIVVATIAIDFVAVVACLIKVDHYVSAFVLRLAVNCAIAIIPWRTEAIANPSASALLLARGSVLALFSIVANFAQVSIDGQVATLLERATVGATAILTCDVAIIANFALVQLTVPTVVENAGLGGGVGSATAAKRADGPRSAGNAIAFHTTCCE